MPQDPICHMEVDNNDFTFDFEGETYYFCSNGCLEKFKTSPKTFAHNHCCDLIIIGAGPAGLTAAVYASVLKINTFLLAKNVGGQAIDSTKIKNYMGFDFISGKDLVKKFRDQFLHRHYLAHKLDEVIKIDKIDDGFSVLTRNRDTFNASAVIVATGLKRRTLGIPGEEKFVRKGVSYSSVQDMGIFKGLDVVVVGGGNSGVQTAAELQDLDCHVTIVEKATLRADPSDVEDVLKGGNVEILQRYDMVEITGTDKVEGVVVQSLETLEKRHIPCRGVFIQVGFTPNTEFCQHLVKLNDKGEIMIAPDCSTSVPGIFACGDVTDCYGKRIIIAAGEGTKAALRAKKYILERKTADVKKKETHTNTTAKK